MSNQYQEEEETGTERVTDIIVGIVGVGAKLLLLLWILLAGMPAVLQGPAAAAEKAVEVPTAAATPEAAEVAQVAPTDVPPTATVEMLELVPVVTPPPVEDAGVLNPADFAIDPSALGLAWVARSVGGEAADPSNRIPGLPPHLLVDFEGEGIDAAAQGLNRPQLRILPIAAYLSMMQAAGSTDAATALDSLKALLAAQTAGDGKTIPTPPFLGDLQQQIAKRIEFLPFDGGQAVGYVTRLASAPGPIANDTGLAYVIQGLTDDGRFYVVGIVPLKATFLPGTVADIPADTLGTIESDVPAYLTSIGDQVESAADSDFTPELGSVRRVLSTIAIGAGLAAKASGAASAEAVAPAAELVGTVWQWTGTTGSADGDVTNDNPQNFQVVFWPDGSYSMKADCNVGGGSYVLDGADLTVNPGMSTLAFCGEESLDGQFKTGLFATTSYEFDADGNLILNLGDGGQMMFANGGPSELAETPEAEEQTDAENAGLTSTAYHWASLTASDGTVTEVPNPENYVVILNPDGTFNFTADCNVGGGVYVYNEDGTITFQTGPMTLAFCGEDSLDQLFLANLNGTTAVTVGDDGNVTATLADGGTASLTNAGPVSLDGGAAAETAGVGGTAAAATGELTGITWQWASTTGLTGGDVVNENPENYQVVFWPDGSYGITADCNVGGGSYVLDGTNLTINPGITTLAFCGETSLDGQYKDSLFATTSYSFDADGNLLLHLSDGATMTFSNGGVAEQAQPVEPPAAAPDALEGTTWQWVNFRDAKQDYSVEGPYTIQFLPGGQIAVVADCNNASGSYAVDGNNVTISILVTTAAACAEGSLGGPFIEHLNFAGTYTIDGTTMLIDLMADGGTMTFAKAK